MNEETEWGEVRWVALSFTLICMRIQGSSDFSCNYAPGEDCVWEVIQRKVRFADYLPTHLCIQIKYGLFLFLQLCEAPFDSWVIAPWLKLIGDHLERKHKIPKAILLAQNFTIECHWRKIYEDFTENRTASKIKLAKIYLVPLALFF